MIEAHRRELLHAIVSAWDDVYDPGPGLLPSGSRYKSLCYALALLELAECSRLGRAEAIVARIIDTPGVPSRRIRRQDDERVSIGFTLSLLWHRHHRRLDPALRRRLSPTIVHMVGNIRKLPAGDLAEIFVLHTAAGLTGDDDLSNDVAVCLRDRLHIAQRDRPAATGEDSAGRLRELLMLHAFENHLRHFAPARGAIEVLIDLAWRKIAHRLKRPDDFHEDLALATLLDRATHGAVALRLPPETIDCDPVDLLFALVVIPRIPDETIAFLRASCPQATVAEIRC
ncbi:hypothetical protein OpiT1DRAFT_02424 [Opitutaceae bacterium TAV1]|nr:hypothetical protein OpiT1DRAFT_02424 [Opitutaceae bacterium TAV1]